MEEKQQSSASTFDHAFEFSKLPNLTNFIESFAPTTISTILKETNSSLLRLTYRFNGRVSVLWQIVSKDICLICQKSHDWNVVLKIGFSEWSSGIFIRFSLEYIKILIWFGHLSFAILRFYL